jgi:two-component system nitrate/nitrite response regulator NarL
MGGAQAPEGEAEARMRCVRVVIADPHPVVLQGLSSMLGAERDFTIVARCSDGVSCLEAIRIFAPDIALLDIAMPDISGPEILAIANTENLATRLVFFTAAVEERNLAMLAAAGAYGVILKGEEPEILVQTLRRVAEGQRSLALSEGPLAPSQTANAERDPAVLTERERQIMRLVSEGLSNKEIGRRLNVADGTIKVHLHHIFQKLDISNRTVLAALALSQQELIEPPGESRIPVTGKR